MTRPKGSKNRKYLKDRDTITTSDSKDIRHLAKRSGVPLQDFLELTGDQEKLLTWIWERHEKIVRLETENRYLSGRKNVPGPVGAKQNVLEKYTWYVEQLVLLEAINSFETFYKRTLVLLADIVREYVSLDSLRDHKVDATTIWLLEGEISTGSLVFGSALFHDLNAIDKVTDTLIGAKRYNQNAKANKIKDRVRCLRGIFQIRHTLSHNHGNITAGDRAKFKRLGFEVQADTVIDPSKDELRFVAIEELRSEASDFTSWLAASCAQFLQELAKEENFMIDVDKRPRLMELFGNDQVFNKVPWSKP